jgi:RHS repeat-associated protein
VFCYRYDTETGLYYLQSRYYNPEWDRFINADALGEIVGQLVSHNLFAYCRNNPVSRLDSDGYRDEPGCGGGGGAYLELGII